MSQGLGESPQTLLLALSVFHAIFFTAEDDNLFLLDYIDKKYLFLSPMTPEKQDLLAQKIVKYFFFSFSFLIFVLFTIGGYGIEEHYAQVRTWSPVTAKVHSISMEEEHRSKGTTYCINSQIIYDYNGASYTSTPRSLFSCHPIKVYAQKTLNQNPPGTPVQVLVNPKDPIQSHGPLRFDYIKLPPLVTLGIFLGIIVLATGFFYFSHQRKLPNVMK